MSRQTTAGGAGSPYLFGYTYDLSGGLKRITYPSGTTVTNTYDAAGRIATVLGPGNKMYATNLGGAIKYWPHGAINEMTHANGLVETTTVNNRLQPTAIQASSLLTLGYKYTPPVGHTTPTTVGNNGNIYEQTVTPGTASSMYIHYDYDGLNRIQWASGYDAAGAPDASTNLTCAAGTSTSAWCHHYSIDAYGNRLIDNRGGLSIPPGEPTAISASTNRATASGGAQWGYDTNGNVMVDGAGNSFTYDAENRQLTGGGAAYAYDGQGRRVTRTQSGGTATFVYDAAGQLAAEYGAAGPASPCGTTCYVTADHLGSTRLVTNPSMTPVERVDYLPYGEEMTFTSGTVQAGAPGYGFYAGGDVRQRFTGKERDGETGLDYFGARYMGAAQGRFTSPDPISGTVLHILNPQRWNMYTYAVNNPLVYLDPDGRDAIAIKYGNLAHNLGHAGIGSVHHDGKGRYADFGPQHPGQAHDAGKYNIFDFATQIKYGPDRKPTKESLTALANELADKEQQPRDSVSVSYYRTSEAETEALDAYFDAAGDQLLQGKTPTYWAGFRDCIWFCANGMQKAHIGQGSSILTVPNFQYLNFWLWASQTATGGNPKPEPEKNSTPQHAPCLKSRDGNCVQ